MDENEKTNIAPQEEAEKKKAATKKSPPVEKAPEKMKKQAYMYLGPNIPGGILFSGQISKGELPAYLADAIKKIPEIKELFIEVKEAPAFKDELKKQGTEAYRLYQNVEKLIGEGVLRNA
jgi:hypothetical protein